MNRFIKDKTFIIYGIIALLNLIAFGFIGIPSVVRSIEDRNNLIVELNTVNSDMKNKLSQMEEADKVYNEATKYLPALNEAITDEEDLQNYLINISNQTAKEGFILNKFNPSKSTNKNGISVSIEVEGDSANISNLISSIEKMPRVTSVENVRLPLADAKAIVNATVTIYAKNIKED